MQQAVANAATNAGLIYARFLARLAGVVNLYVARAEVRSRLTRSRRRRRLQIGRHQGKRLRLRLRVKHTVSHRARYKPATSRRGRRRTGTGTRARLKCIDRRATACRRDVRTAMSFDTKSNSLRLTALEIGTLDAPDKSLGWMEACEVPGDA